MRRFAVAFASLLVCMASAQQTTAQGAPSVPAAGVQSKFSGPLRAATVNGVIYADQVAGPQDIGAKLTAAMAAASAYCGTVALSPGDYVQTSMIVKPRCVHLVSQGARLHPGMTDGVTPAMVTGSAPVGAIGLSTYSQGSVENISIQCTSKTNDGILMGGSGNTADKAAPADNGDALETFQNVEVAGCRDGLVIGQNVFQNAFLANSFHNNAAQGIHVVGAASENMNFYGTQLLNNGAYGFYGPAMLGSEYFFENPSVDYNAAGGIYTGLGFFHAHGGHYEEINTAYFFNGPDVANADDLGNASLVIDGAPNFVLGSASTVPAIVRMTGHNSRLFIGDGINVYSPQRGPITAFVDWEVAGYSSMARIGSIWDGGKNPGIRPLISGTAVIHGQQVLPPAYQDLAIIGQYAQTDRIMSALSVGSASIAAAQGSGYVGSSNNLSGKLPPIPGSAGAPMPGGGSYLGYNAEGIGDADFFSPTPSTANGNDAFAWYALLSGTWQRVMHVDRAGDLALKGTVASTALMLTGTGGDRISITTNTAPPSGSCASGSLATNSRGTLSGGNNLFVCVNSAWIAVK